METLLDTEALIGLLILMLNHIMETVIFNHQAERVHHAPDLKTFKTIKRTKKTIITLVTLEHNHLITIEMEIAHDDHSHVIPLEMCEIICTQI